MACDVAGGSVLLRNKYSSERRYHHVKLVWVQFNIREEGLHHDHDHLNRVETRVFKEVGRVHPRGGSLRGGGVGVLPDAGAGGLCRFGRPPGGGDRRFGR